MVKRLCTLLAALLTVGVAASVQSIPVLTLVFTGTTALNPNRLKALLRVTHEGGFYNSEVLSGELAIVERYCQDEGYLRAKVGPPSVEFREVASRGKSAVIRIPVTEGPLYSLGEISVRNATAFNSSVLAQMCPLRSGQPFSRKKMNVWKEKVADGYQTMGYIRFDAAIIERIDETKKTVDASLDCKEGRAYQVGKITVLGIPVAEQSSFKRHLLLGEGGLFNPEMIGMSLYFVNQMGIYKPLSPSDVEMRIDDARSIVDLVFRLVPTKREGPTGPSALNGSLPRSALGLVPTRTQDPQTTIKTEVALVNLVFSVTDRNNRSVSGLTASDFFVFEDKQPQKVEFFSALDKGTPIPLTIAFLIDTSGSVKNKLDFEKDTASEFFKSVLRKGKDLALIIQFDSDVNLVQDFTDDTNRLIRSLDALEAGNSTALYDAVYLAVEEKLKTETGRRVIVILTDGEDTSSKLRKEVAIESAQKSDVLIYGIGVRGEYGTNFGILKRFAEETGGLFFSPRAKLAEIQAAFQAIGEDLQGQYSLAYSSTNPKRDGSFRNVEIRPKVGGIRVRARKGYYAPRAAQAASN